MKKFYGMVLLELAKAIKAFIKNDVSGLYHLGAKEKLTKDILLNLIRDILGRNKVTILPNRNLILNRSIKNTKFHYSLPSYENMLTELKDWMDNK